MVQRRGITMMFYSSKEVGLEIVKVEEGNIFRHISFYSLVYST